MKKLFFVLVLLLTLVGCAVKPEIRYVTKVETVTTVIEPPISFYSPFKRIAPPGISEYIDLGWDDKEKVLFEHIFKLNTQIEALAIDRVAIGKLVVEQKLIALEER